MSPSTLNVRSISGGLIPSVEYFSLLAEAGFNKNSITRTDKKTVLKKCLSFPEAVPKSTNYYRFPDAGKRLSDGYLKCNSGYDNPMQIAQLVRQDFLYLQEAE